MPEVSMACHPHAWTAKKLLGRQKGFYLMLLIILLVGCVKFSRVCAWEGTSMMDRPLPPNPIAHNGNPPAEPMALVGDHSEQSR